MTSHAPATPQPESSIAWWKRSWYVPVLVLYMTLVFVAVAYHEPWFDEAQSWLIARDCSLWQMTTYALRYEGSPGLWHAILLLPAKCHWPYLSANVIGGVIASAGIWLFLRHSPFPKLLTALLPFTYFLAYQYAAIARNYVLFPLLVFALAAIYRRRLERPRLFAILLIFLANVTAHGFLIAGCLATLFVISVARGWKQCVPLQRHCQVQAIVLYVIAAILVIAEVWPPSDVSTRTGVTQGLLDPARFGKALETLDDGFCQNIPLTVSLILASCWWFWRTRVLAEFLLPFLAVCAFFVFIYCVDHHAGIPFLIWLFAMWRSLDELRYLPTEAQTRPPGLLARRAVIVSVTALVTVQIFWTACAVRHEVEYDYCGSRAMAEFLRRYHLTEKRIAAAQEWATAILPYFDTNIFANFDNKCGSCFINWSESAFAKKLAFSRDSTLHEDYDAILMPVNYQPLAKAPWHEPGFSVQLSPHWRQAVFIDGRVIKKASCSCRTGYALYVKQDLADQLGLVGSHRPAESSTALAAPECSEHERRIALADLHLQFGNLLRGRDPTSAIVHYQNVLAIQCDDRETVEEGLAAAMMSYHATAHNNLGALLTKQDPRQAAQHYRSAIKLDPSIPDAYVNLANFYVRSGRLEEAVELYTQALKISPTNAAARRNLGVVLEIRREPMAARLALPRKPPTPTPQR